MATDLLAKMPVLTSKRAHHVVIADLLQTETVGKVGREGHWEWFSDANPVVLVESKGERHTAIPRPGDAAH